MRDIPYGYCHCGCGERTEIITGTIRSIGWYKGEPKRYIHGHQSRKPVVECIEEDQGYTTPCWVWQRFVDKKGYGLMRPYGSKHMHPAHRVYYERAKGPIPEGMQLDHLCHDPDSCVGGPECPHRRCVNPDHLEPVTPRENSNRGQAAPGRPHKPGRKPKPKRTHCKRGHEFAPENTYIAPDGGRYCRICLRAKQARLRERRKRAEPPARPSPPC